MKVSRPVPLCGRCNNRHYNVMSCERAAAREKELQAKAEFEESRQVYPRWRTDGPRRFGDNLPSFNRQGNTFWRKRESK